MDSDRTLMNIKLSSGETWIYEGDRAQLVRAINDGAHIAVHDLRGYNEKTGPILGPSGDWAVASHVTCYWTLWPK